MATKTRNRITKPVNEVASIINCEDPERAKVLLLSLPYDGTSSFGKGADRGAQLIRSCLENQIELRQPRTGQTSINGLTVGWQEVPMVRRRGRRSLPLSPERMVEVARAAYLESLWHSQFVIVIGGEHSVTNAPLQAIRQRKGGRQRKVAILQIDAHFDLRDNDADFNPCPHGVFAHCSVMRRAVEDGYHLVSVGIRAFSEEELTVAKDLVGQGRLTCFPWNTWDPALDWETNLKQRRVSVSVEGIVRSLPEDHEVYITVDVDGLDPACAPATGTPVPEGLRFGFLQDLLHAVFRQRRVIGADVVEVAVRNPKRPDHAEALTAYTAAQLIYDMIAYHSYYVHTD